jgi:DNA-binding transcriptional MerR regulator
MDSKTLSLQELADLTGTEPRTIRSYVERGVIPGPETMGRGARYPWESLDRLRVFQLLRDANPGLSVDQIRQLLQSLTPAVISDIAEGRQRISNVIAVADPPYLHPKGDALEYLHSLKSSPTRTPNEVHRQANAPHQHHARSPGLSQADDQLHVLEKAAKALANLAGTPPAARSLQGKNWYRLRITPDIELSIRGELAPEQVAQLRRIAAALKSLLTKGPK